MKSHPQVEQNHPVLFGQRLVDMLNREHELCRIAEAFDWDQVVGQLESCYSHRGRPGKPIRLMVGLLLLKHLRNLSDERVVAQYEENPYFQYFCGQADFCTSAPCAASELSHFRKRIGEGGIKLIFSASVRLNGKAMEEQEVVADTTAQEKNITYPTDAKQALKVCDLCLRIARREELPIRRSYRYTLPKLKRKQHNAKNPKRVKEARRAMKSIQTIAGRLLREVERNLKRRGLDLTGNHRYEKPLALCYRVLGQQRQDKNKIYSLHEPETACIAKGKAHKKYEYGSKASIVRTIKSRAITAVKTFAGNPYDGDTLKSTLAQSEAITGKRPNRCYTDLGYRGKRTIEETTIIYPGSNKKNITEWEKRKRRWGLRKRSGIEATISHLKRYYGLNRTYLKGLTGDSIQLLLAAGAYNLALWARAHLFVAILRLLWTRSLRLFLLSHPDNPLGLRPSHASAAPWPQASPSL